MEGWAGGVGCGGGEGGGGTEAKEPLVEDWARVGGGGNLVSSMPGTTGGGQSRGCSGDDSSHVVHGQVLEQAAWSVSSD